MQPHRFSVGDLASIATHWDDAVDRMTEVDSFCTSSIWSFSAATSFPEVDEPVVVGDGQAFCGMRRTKTEDGTALLVGLDPIWGFATPAVGAPRAAAAMLAARLTLDEFDLAVVSAQREDSVMTACIAGALERDYRLLRGPVQHRLRVDLTDGLEAWFGRRSSRFRQRLRGIRRDAAARGVEVVDVSAMPSDDLFDRVLAVEQTSWKGAEATGLAGDDLATFYRQMSRRLAQRDHLRVLIARIDDRDVGFVLGGIRGDVYRGLQLSYAADVADLGLGHLLQIEQLERLVAEGVATYDLGMDMEYKRRWADRIDETISVVLAR